MADLRTARRSLSAFAEIVGWPLAGFQARSFDPLDRRVTCVVSPRQGGKSRSLGVLATHWAFKKRRQHILVVSAGEAASRRLLATVKAIVNGSELLRGSVIDERAGLIVLSNGSEIRSVPASEAQIRGWSVDLLLIDEAALLGDDMILGAAFPTTAARPDARIVLASSATAASGAFYDHVQLGRQGSDNVCAFAWALTDCEWIASSTIEAARESLTPARFAAEYEGTFSSAADSLFPRALLERCTAPYELPGLWGLGSHAGMAGVDWGATTDRTALVSVSRLTNPPGVFALTCAHAWRSGEPLDGPEGVIPQIAGLGADWEIVNTERNGLGWPLSESLAEKLKRKAPQTEINFVTTTGESKSAGYSALRLLMEQQRLVLAADATELLRELLLLRVQITQSGGEKIEAGVGHDDLADAFYLATGPYPVDGRVQTRLRNAADKPVRGEPTQFEGETVETGAGLVLPKQLDLARLDGSRFGLPQVLPQTMNPWANPGSSKRPGARSVGKPWAIPADVERWFDRLSPGRPW